MWHNYQSALIHLSDLEFGENNRGGGDAVKEGNISCADKLIADIRSVLYGEQHFVGEDVGLVITGDITTSGEKKDFDIALNVITHIRDELRIPENQVAVVPGNHDVCWSDYEEALKLLPTEQKARMVPHELNELERKLNSFSVFFRGLCPGLDFPKPCTAVAFDGFVKLGVALVGFDTTHPCTSKETNHGLLCDDQERAGKEQLERLLEKNKRLIPTAMMHHAIRPSLADESDTSHLWNHEQAAEWLQNDGFSLFICGHEHKPTAVQQLGAASTTLVTGTYGLTAAKLNERYRGAGLVPNTYQMLLLDPEGESRLLLRELEVAGSSDSAWKGSSKVAEAPVVTRRPRIQAHKQRADKVHLCLSDHVLLDEEMMVLAFRLDEPEDQLDVVNSVTYTVNGTKLARNRNRDSHFLADFLFQKRQHVSVTAEIVTEMGSVVRTEIKPEPPSPPC